MKTKTLVISAGLATAVMSIVLTCIQERRPSGNAIATPAQPTVSTSGDAVPPAISSLENKTQTDDQNPAIIPLTDAADRNKQPIARPVQVPVPTGEWTPSNPYAQVAAPGSKAPAVGNDGLWPVASSAKHGEVIMESVSNGFRQGRPTRIFDRIIRVEGRRYPAVRVIQTTQLNAATGKHVVLETREMAADQILVHLNRGVTPDQLSQAIGQPLSLRRFIRGTGTAVLAFPVTAPDTVDKINATVAAKQDFIQFTEPDHIVRAFATPNDPKYTDGSLWGMNNTGQSSGTSDADVDAPEGWNTRTSAISNAITQSRATRTAFGYGANELVIAVVDTGVRYTHEDLASNMWMNPGETPGNGIDDDNNGVIDDVHGVNAVADNGDPMDDHYHGTHCAGTIAAVGNNGKGVTGIAWQAKIVACKFLAADGSGTNSDASEALWYAWEQAGADVISCSFGGGSESSEVTNQMMAAGRNGTIVVVAAGNDNADLADTATYPAASQLENIVTVAATTRTDTLSSFSNYNYGWANVGAPGSDITSLGIDSDSDYAVLSGTSMATPLTAGIVALLRAQYPNDNYGQIINRLYRGVDPISALNLKVQTGGRVNLQKALAATSYAPFNDDFSAASAMPASAPHSLRTANFSATAESGEPAHGGLSAHKTVWYKWTAPSTANFILSTQGSAYSTFTAGTGGDADSYGSATLDTVLGVYTGSAVNALTLVAQNNDYDDAGTSRLWSRLSFPATSGTTYYFAVGTAPSASVQEGMIILSVSEPPANDLFAAATVVGSTPYSADKSNLNALRETGEPRLHRANVAGLAPTPALQAVLDANFPDKNGALDEGGASVWWRWTPSVTAEYTVATSGSMIDTVLGIYTGSTLNALTLVAENDDIGLVRFGSEYLYLTFSRIRRTFTAGVTYFIQVDGFMGKQGDVTLSISQPPANDHLAAATVVTGNLWSTTVNNVGASFEDREPVHAGEYGGVSVWFKWVAPSTQDYQLTLPISTITTALAVYTSPTPAAPVVSTLVEVAADSTPILGSNVRLSAVAGQTYFIAVDGVNGKQRADMQLDLSPTPGALLNDDFADRTPLLGTSASVGSTTSGAAFETGEPDIFGSSSQRSVWWTWTAPASGTVYLTTQYSAYNATLGVYSGSAVNALTEIAKNIPPAGQSASDYGRVTLAVTRGTTYQIGVFGNAAYCGNVMLNLSLTPTNALPSVTSSTLSSSGLLYADEPLSVSSVTTGDPENNPVSVAYQWQSSADRFTWTSVSGKTSATLPADSANAELFWRCRLSPSDATGDGNPFYTEAVAFRCRPLQLARHGQTFSYRAGLPIEGALAPAKRGIIINEFSKTDSASAVNGTASDGEWIEFLALRDVNLSGYFLSNIFRSIRFLDVPLWQNVPRGTLVVIYNPTGKSALLPADDLDASDGRIVVSGGNASYFDNGNGFAPTFPKFSGSADTGSDVAGTGARLVLSRAFIGTVDDISFHNVSVLGGDSQFYRNPHLTTTLAVRQTYHYTGDTEDACESSTRWELGTADTNFATPGQPNNQLQIDWLAKLRAPAPRYRFASNSNNPADLSIDPVTGIISGTVNQAAGGLFRLHIERYASGSTTQSQSIDFLVGTAAGVFTLPSGQTFTLTGPLDLGNATLLNQGGILQTNGYTLVQKQSYTSWATAHGVSGGPDATFAPLGIPNRLAFALNLSATVADLPEGEVLDISGQRYLSLVFRRQKAPNRVAYTVQSSADLASWQNLDTAAQMVGSPTSLDHATEEVIVRDTAALGTGAPRRFLRLRVADNLTPPAAPTSPAASLGTAQAIVTWSPVAGAESYTVKRGTVSGGPYTALASGLAGTSYTDATVATGTTYYYIVTAATSADGESLASAEINVTTPATWTPLAPAGLAATANAMRVGLTWNTVANATSYTVRRSTTSGIGYADLATGLTSAAYNDTTASIGTTYYYVVLAANAAGSGPASAQVSGAVVQPVAWWKFNESSGTTAANSGGTGTTQNVSLVSGTGVTWGAGKFANAATLDGTSNTYFRSANNLTAGTTNTCTITLWVKSSLSSAGWRGLFYDRSGSVQKGLHTNNGVLRIGNWETDNQTSAGLTVPDNTWTFVALTVSPTQMKAWLRTDSASSFSTWTSATTSFTARQWQRPGIGGSNYPAEVVAGQIDDVRYYDRTLTEAELAAIYANANQ